jgi:serine/threonine-protein kinase HipA
MTQRKLTVFIYLPGESIAVPAGIFTHDQDSKIGSFAYGHRYIERNNALPVDPVALPLGPSPREVLTNGGFYGAFRDASPDYWGRLVIAANTGSPPEALSEVDFLVAANTTRVGNLDFRSSPDDPEPLIGPPHYDELIKILTAAEQLEKGERPAEHLLHLLDQGSSMGGARPKCTVEWQDAQWIAKFPSRNDTLDIPRIEYATMKLASRCGIRIPEIKLESIGNRHVYLARRFDRENTANGWLRRGFLSSLSFMQWDEHDNVKWDYVAIADVMRQYMGSEFLVELFRRMVFNILVRNTDDHPRNHGFLVDDSGNLLLSPAYDIIPSLAMPGIGTEFKLAMSVGNQGRNATIENALSQAPRFGLSAIQARGIIEELLEIVAGWQDYFGELGIDEQEIEFWEPSFYKCKEVS